MGGMAHALLRRADTIQTDGIAVTIGNDVVARLLGEEFMLFALSDTGSAATSMNDCRDDVLHTRERAHALNHGDG